MIRNVWKYIKLNNMIQKGDRIVVGVSGGADSICLLHVLNKLCKDMEIILIVVHINHGIRGAEAYRDENFVKELCDQLEIEFYQYYFEVKTIAKEEGLSEEEAGRKVRYEAFLDVCKQKKCNKIAIAHNKNDNAETVLFHLFRGSGIKGLSGIEPKRVIVTDFGEVGLIRPLLCIERREIEDYLREEGEAYLVDSTNLTEDYSRNKIRNRILDYATKEINLQAVDNIAEAANQLKEIEEYMKEKIEQGYHRLVHLDNGVYFIEVHDIAKEALVIQKGIIYLILERLADRRKDLEAKHVEAILSLFGKQVGKCVHLPYGMIAEREYNNIRFFDKNKKDGEKITQEGMKPVLVPAQGKVFIPQIQKNLETEIINYKKNEPIPKSSCEKWFDYDKIENAVEIRTRKEGDYIQVNATGGHKKLKQYFIDQKIPQKQRDNQILITDGNHVMWIPGDGERMSEKYKVEASTTKILLMKMIDLEDKKDGR